MKLQKPDATARGNCPSGGQEFAMVVWRYVRSLALAAKAQALKLSGEGEGFQQTAAYLQTYLQLLRVRPYPACRVKNRKDSGSEVRVWDHTVEGVSSSNRGNARPLRFRIRPQGLCGLRLDC